MELGFRWRNLKSIKEMNPLCDGLKGPKKLCESAVSGIFVCSWFTFSFSLLQTLPLGPKVPYVLLVYEAEDFCNLVANERLLENISRVRDQYPSYKVCYLTNKLMSYVNKRLSLIRWVCFALVCFHQEAEINCFHREKEEYKNLGKSNGWRRPPIDEVLHTVLKHTYFSGKHVYCSLFAFLNILTFLVSDVEYRYLQR